MHEDAMTMELTRSERDMLLTALLTIKASDTHWGNRKVFKRRLNRLIARLDYRRRWPPEVEPEHAKEQP
jgi:hypothetical protein